MTGQYNGMLLCADCIIAILKYSTPLHPDLKMTGCFGGYWVLIVLRPFLSIQHHFSRFDDEWSVGRLLGADRIMGISQCSVPFPADLTATLLNLALRLPYYSRDAGTGHCSDLIVVPL